jgi:KipI family sensor histidine kinase inhibitor
MVHPFGEGAFMIEGPEEISEANFTLMRSVARALADAGRRGASDPSSLAGLRELVPAYRSVLAIFDPGAELSGMAEKIEGLLDSLETVDEGEREIVELPVRYGGESGIDLAEVAARAGISEEEVVAIHSGGLYRVFMIGFTPGFPYLGGMSARIATPRRKDPRLRIEAGSVGIADSQTGVYPLASPGGWNIIGRTPLRLFDPRRDPPALLSAGQFVRFVPVDKSLYRSLAGADSVTGPGPKPETSRIAPGGGAGAGAGAGEIEILSGGMLTTVQDKGRYGYQSMGVSPSGAMDRLSLELANIALGNDPGEAGLEITLLGPDIRFSAETRFAIAGGRCEATLSGKSLPMYESIAAGAGDMLSLGPVLSGMRCYLAVAGGFALDPVMGSLSTSLQGSFGGFRGRRLMAGDMLGLKACPAVSGARPVPLRMRPEFSDRYRLRVTLSHEKDRFTEAAMETFFASSWSVSPKSDRMGIRLAGPELAHARGADIISSAVLTGCIQVPGQGNPIILAADRQTTGGYTRLAQVIAADLSILGRLKPGDMVEFGAIGQDEARRLYREYSDALAGLAAGSPGDQGAACRGTAEVGERIFRVEVNGRSYMVGVTEV